MFLSMIKAIKPGNIKIGLIIIPKGVKDKSRFKNFQRKEIIKLNGTVNSANFVVNRKEHFLR